MLNILAAEEHDIPPSLTALIACCNSLLPRTFDHVLVLALILLAFFLWTFLKCITKCLLVANVLRQSGQLCKDTGQGTLFGSSWRGGSVTSLLDSDRGSRSPSPEVFSRVSIYRKPRLWDRKRVQIFPPQLFPCVQPKRSSGWFFLLMWWNPLYGCCAQSFIFILLQTRKKRGGKIWTRVRSQSLSFR